MRLEKRDDRCLASAEPGEGGGKVPTEVFI